MDAASRDKWWTRGCRQVVFDGRKKGGKEGGRMFRKDVGGWYLGWW